jgi:hypothetical protein
LEYDIFLYFCNPKGEVAEWSIAAVLKTVDLQGSGGSNPPFSANKPEFPALRGDFYFLALQFYNVNSKAFMMRLFALLIKWELKVFGVFCHH